MSLFGSIYTGQKEISVFDENISIYSSSNGPISTHEATLYLEGSVFDQSCEDLCQSQSVLDNAFGYFTYLRISLLDKKITIGSDKLGFSPLYYSIVKDNLYFSDSLSKLKSVLPKPSPDFEAWDDLLNLGDILGNKTTIKEIHRLPYGTRISIENGNIRFFKFWEPEVVPYLDSASFVKKNTELLYEAMAHSRIGTSNKIVLMSGGDDSRRVGAAAKVLGLPVQFATQEAIHSGNLDDDVIIASMVANDLSIPLIRQPLPSPDEALYNETCRDDLLGFETNHHAWLYPLIKSLPRKSLIYDGLLGDITINGHYFRECPSFITTDSNVDRIANQICHGKTVFNISHLDKNSLVSRVINDLEKIPSTAHQITWFKILTHARRNTSLQGQIYRSFGHQVCFPFLYYPLLIQSMALDPKEHLSSYFQSRCAELAIPGIGLIPSTRRGLERKHIIDFSEECKRKDKLFLKNLHISNEVRSIFCDHRKHFLSVDLAKKTGSLKLYSRIKWFAEPMSRFSSFLDWLKKG